MRISFIKYDCDEMNPYNTKIYTNRERYSPYGKGR